MDIYQIIIKEIENVLLSVDRQEIKVLKQEILMARRIYVAGAGRSGLVAGSFVNWGCVPFWWGKWPPLPLERGIFLF